MGRPTIADLQRPPKPRISAKRRIETLSDARAEDRRRLRSALRAVDHNPDLGQLEGMPSLIDRLDASVTRDWKVDTLASAVRSRQWRLPVTEQLCLLTSRDHLRNPSTFTLVRPSWIIPHADLTKVCAARLMEQIRADLNGNLRGERDGWLFAKLDDEFDIENQLHRFHAHGIASGTLVDEVDGLRSLRRYRPQLEPPETGRRIARPVWIDRRPLTDLPRAISYILKGHFTARYTGPVGSAGAVKRSRQKQRIPEPFHTETLLWLHRHKLSQLTLMINLRVQGGQLISK